MKFYAVVRDMCFYFILTSGKLCTESKGILREEIMNVMLDFIIQNGWKNIIFFTDEDSKYLYRQMSFLFLKCTIIPMASHGNLSSLLLDLTTISDEHQSVIALGVVQQHTQLIMTAQRLGMFGRRFSWLFVHDINQWITEVKNTLQKNTELTIFSNSFLLTQIYNQTSQQRSFRVLKIRNGYFIAPSYFPNTLPEGLKARITTETIKQSENTTYHQLDGIELKIATFQVRVAIKECPPYVEIDDVGSERSFRGYTIEIIKVLSETLGFKYSFVIEKSRVFGGLKDGKWTGLVGIVHRKEVDVGAVGLALTQERGRAVDFSSYLHMTHIAVVIRRPTENSQECSFAIYARPFSLIEWIIIALISCLMFGCIFFALRLLLHRNARPDFFFIRDLIFLLLGIILQSGSSGPKRVLATLRKPSTHTILLTFTFLAILVNTYYGTLLTAFLTIKAKPKLYNDLDELINDGKYGISVLAQSSSYEEFKNANFGVLRRIWNKINTDPNSLVTGDDAGFRKALAEDYVYLPAEVYAAHRMIKSNCKLTYLRQRYLRMTMHLIFQKNSLLTDVFSVGTLRMRSSGILKRLENKYLPKFDEAACILKPSMTITVQQTIGAFAALGAGILVSAIILLCEIAFIKKNTSNNRDAKMIA